MSYTFRNSDGRVFEADDGCAAPLVGGWVGFDEDQLLVVADLGDGAFATVPHPSAAEMMSASFKGAGSAAARWNRAFRVHLESADVGPCPKAECAGRLRPVVSDDLSAWEAERCDVCSARWWFNPVPRHVHEIREAWLPALAAMGQGQA